MNNLPNLLSSINTNGLVGKMLSGMATKNFAAGLLAGGVGSQLVGKDTLEGTAKLGGLALLGTLAYKAYGFYTQAKASGQPVSITGAVKQGANDMMAQGKSLAANFSSLIANAKASSAAPQAVSNETPELALAIMRAMIGAAKADGKVDADETKRILGHLESQGLEAAEKSLLMQELANAQDVASIAAAARTPEQGAEIYLAALLVCDSQCAAEQAYLTQLAAALKLDAAFTQALQNELLTAQQSHAA